MNIIIFVDWYLLYYSEDKYIESAWLGGVINIKIEIFTFSQSRHDEKGHVSIEFKHPLS